jgi:hypothetical protein
MHIRSYRILVKWGGGGFPDVQHQLLCLIQWSRCAISVELMRTNVILLSLIAQASQSKYYPQNHS